MLSITLRKFLPAIFQLVNSHLFILNILPHLIFSFLSFSQNYSDFLSNFEEKILNNIRVNCFSHLSFNNAPILGRSKNAHLYFFPLRSFPVFFAAGAAAGGAAV